MRKKINLTINGFFISFFMFSVICSTVIADEVDDANCSVFYKLMDDDDSKAIEKGEELFNVLVKKHRADAGFNALKSKLIAADFLTKKMVSQLRKATGGQVFSMANELFNTKQKVKKKNSMSIAPAKSFYETSIEIFSKPVRISKLNNAEKKFLGKYYDLKLRVFTNSIARAGQALAVAEPSFKGTHDYVLVLPLLHASEKRSVNIDIMPKWMRSPEQLNVFSDSCLLHFGFPYHACTFAKEASKVSGRDFVIEQFYKVAANKSRKTVPHVAVDCLERAIETLDESDLDGKVDLNFEIVKIWLDSGNYKLAAGQAKKMYISYGNHVKAGEIIWNYYYALSKANDAQSIISEIDTVINDSRCKLFRAKLIYMKWWALRRQRNQPAAIAVVEYELLKDYKDDPIVAPILLSRATDSLAGQDYSTALSMLEDINEKFPNTNAAKQALKMVEKLKALKKI